MQNEPKRIQLRIEFFHGRNAVLDFIRPDKLRQLFTSDVSVAEFLNDLCDEIDHGNPPPDGWDDYYPVLSMEVYAREGFDTKHRITILPRLENLDETVTALAVGIVGMYCEVQDEWTPEEFYQLVDDRIRELLLTAQRDQEQPGVTTLPVFTRFRRLGPTRKQPWYKRLFGRKGKSDE